MTSRSTTGAATRGGATDRSRIRAQPGALEHPAEVVPGVTITWDPEHPHHCVQVTAADDHDPAAVDTVPWLRLASVSVLDRQLYLPLDQSLLDAERAAAEFDAARTLGREDALRDELVRRALVGARAASHGVATYLGRLATDRRRPPPVLAAALDGVVRRYAALSGEVHGADDALAAVVDAGHRLSSSVRGAVPRRPVVAPAPVPPTPGGVDRVDPRSLPARVVRFGPTCDAAEIVVVPIDGSGGPAVRVRVEAYPPPGGRAVDVGVQLIDRRTGSVRGHGLLGRTTPAGGAPPGYTECVVALPPALSVADVRVHLVDAADGPPDRRHVDDRELRRVRQATLFQSQWRALVADVRLWGVRTAPVTRLREIVARLGEGTAGDALWSGGPSLSQLRHLVELGDWPLTAWLRDGRTPSGSVSWVLVESVSGPGDLLAAEIAAAYDRSRR